MITGDVLGERARLSPEKTALVEVATGRRFTYAELDARAKAAARVLTEVEGLGLKKGDRLALLAGNCVEFLDVFFACGKTGVVLVPLNTRQTAGELEGVLEDAQPTVLIYGATFEETVEDLLRRVRGVRAVALDAPAAPGAPAAPVRSAHITFKEIFSSLPSAPTGADAESSSSSSPGPEDLYCLLYTSGTTGKPKGVMVPHRMVAWNAVNTVVSWQLREDDVSPIYTPLYHAGGLGAFLTPIFAVGGTIVLLAGFDPAEVLKAIARERCTVALGVPTIFRMLQEHPDWATADISSIRYFACGGAPLPLDIIETWQKRGANFKQGYGLTEVGVNCFAMSVEESVRKAGSIGRPMMFTEAKLTDEQGKEVPIGEVGELLLKGPHVCKGYYKNPEATAAALDAEGWFHTGDLAKRDADGFFTIAGRKKDMLISGGVNVYPAEIEGVLFQHPRVKDVAVVGVPDEKWGEVGVAFIVRREEEGKREEKISLRVIEEKTDLAAFVEARLAKYKVPREFVFVDALPRTPYGKVVKRDLLLSYLSKKSSSSSSSSGVLAHRIDGEGPPLLLLNGGMMSFSAWEPIARRFAERHRVIRCDFRGQLHSPGEPRASMEEHADDVAALLDALGESRVDVVAASYGAYVGLLLAARHPELVGSVLAATVTDVAKVGDAALGETGARLAAAVRAAARGGDRTEVYDAIVQLAYTPEWQAAHADELAVRRGQVGLLPGAWFTGLEGLLGALEKVDLRAILPTIACPVLVLAAGRDAAMPLERTQAVAAAIPGASLVVVPGAGHALIVEREDEFVLLAERFLAGVHREAGSARST
ncbi:MAG: alpha/beta fold hydrolase [Acidobacteriota bacterium]|nr:alpha/beta fold hydrolase [Acidobacteriota bacterium]